MDVRIHEDWKFNKNNFDADVAVVTLFNPINVMPICLPPPNAGALIRPGGVVVRLKFRALIKTRRLICCRDRLDRAVLTSRMCVSAYQLRRTTSASRTSRAASKTCRREPTAPAGPVRISSSRAARQAPITTTTDPPGSSRASSPTASYRRTNATLASTPCSLTSRTTSIGSRRSLSVTMRDLGRTLNSSARLHETTSELFDRSIEFSTT